MLKIGELAKICNVSTQTLRFYDREGIFSPEEVDSASGYRYYGNRQVETLKSIIKLKSLGFELSEIKEILAADESEKIRLCKKKINTLSRKAGDFRDNIYEIRRLCLDDSAPKERKRSSLKTQMLSLTFENDEEAIGKWALRGRCKENAADIAALLAAENPESAESYIQKTLFFLPGGRWYWVFAWTKGVLYRASVWLSCLIPNYYKIIDHGGKVYMLINWKSDDGKTSLLLYEKIDGNHYTERGTRIFCDNTDIPFVGDPEFVGIWRTCTFVRDIESFSPEKKYENDDLGISGITAFERGLCCKDRRGNGAAYADYMEYSKGVVIDKKIETVEHYTIKKFNVGGKTETYLFLEHKSGDYFYGGKVNVYYVFKKEV